MTTTALFLRPGTGSLAVRVALVTAVVLAWSSALAVPAPDSVQWTIEGSVTESTEISGLEINSAGHGILVADETAVVQPVTASGTSLSVGPELVVSNPGGREIDLEAVAADSTSFYATGSHGLSRGSAKFRKDRFQLFLLSYDVGTATLAERAVVSLRDLLRARLEDYAEKPLQKNGVNIEGLAYRDGNLYVGFRGPNVDGKAPVVVVDAKQVFEDPTTAHRFTHWVELGEGIGIRGMTSVPEGFLLVAGDTAVTVESDDEHENMFEAGHPFTIRFWDGASGTATELMTVATPSDQKVESITYLGGKDAKSWRVLVLFEGAPNGNPTELRVRKPF